MLVDLTIRFIADWVNLVKKPIGVILREVGRERESNRVSILFPAKQFNKNKIFRFE